MKLFFILLVILLILFIPIPIKISIYYSTINYYIKLYKITIISKDKLKRKKEFSRKIEPTTKKKHKLISKLKKEINIKSLISNLNKLNPKFKPLLRIKFSLEYSLNDAARTAIFYGVLCQTPSLIYILLKAPFNIHKFNYKIIPIFEDKFLLKIETSSIIFLSFANIIYMIIILLKDLKNKGGDPLSGE